MSQAISRTFQRLRLGILGPCRRLYVESGNSIIELAVIIAFLFPPLLFGTTDMAVLLYSSIEISNAAHAGAIYGSRSTTFAVDNVNITAVAQADASGFGANLTATPTSYYACSAAQGGAQYFTLSAATSACTGNLGSPLLFVKVLTSAPVPLPFSCCGMSSSVTLRGLSVMEVQGQ
jgi:Flp pilus assembly protein TadG